MEDFFSSGSMRLSKDSGSRDLKIVNLKSPSWQVDILIEDCVLLELPGSPGRGFIHARVLQCMSTILQGVIGIQ